MNKLRALGVPAAGIVLLYAIDVSLTARAYASKCFGLVIYDLELESVEPASTPFPAATSEGWPIVWPESATLQLTASKESEVVIDDAHILFAY